METEILVCQTVNLKRGTPGGTGVKATSKAAASDRTVTGICSVFGNKDSTDDIVAPGAFAKSIKEFNSGTARAKFVWSHSSSDVPIARIVELRELARHELPAQLKNDSNIEGGLLVRRQYLTDYFADRVYRAVLAGAVDEMSFAFNVEDYEYRDVKGEKCRVVKGVELFDVSDVVWGANSKTLGLVKGTHILSLEKVQALKEKRLKEIERKEQLEELRYYTSHLPKKPLTRQMWNNQMRLNAAKLERIKLLT